MIEAKELRTENWVNVDGEELKVKEIHERGLRLERGIGCLYNLVKPIPLTEEWLIKFGFEDNGRDSYGVHLFEKDGFEIARPYRSKTYLCENITINGVSGFDIKHVHSLQNLYFALTGEELTIK